MKSWAVKRSDGNLLLAKTGTTRLFKVRKDADAAAKTTKGGAKAQRVEIVEV